MLEINGLKYSKEQFEGYKFRAIILCCKDLKFHPITIYTTDTDGDNFLAVLDTKVKEGVKITSISHWCSKEQDDRDTEFMIGWLSEA